jgi:hypothetical protein
MNGRSDRTKELHAEGSTGDAVADLLLSGAARTVAEAEEIYLEAHLDEVLELVAGPLPEAEFRAHPLIALLLARGSRPYEDSLE